MKYYNQRIRSYRETGKRAETGKGTASAGTCSNCCSWRGRRDILAAELPPHRSMRSQPHERVPNPEQQRGKEVSSQYLAVGDQLGFTLLGRLRVHPPRYEHSCSYSTSLGSSWSGLWLLGRPCCHTQVLWKGLLVIISSDFKGPSIFWGGFWQRLDSDWTVWLGKEDQSPLPKHTASAPHTCWATWPLQHCWG